MKRIGLFLLTNIAVVLTISIVVRVLGLGQYLTPYGVDYISLAVYCSVWGFAGAFISLFMSKFMAKMMMGVEVVDNDPQYAALVNTVHSLARKAELRTMPEVGIYHSSEINAFATGPSRSNSIVAVSTGLLNSMHKDEVEGVLAHEVAHIANGDMVTMTLLQGVINSFVYFLSKVAALAMRDNDKERPSFFLEIMFQIIFSILGSMITAWFSRQREFRADAGAAYLGGKDKMISALKRLQNNTERIDSSNTSIAAMKISSKNGFLSLLSTHPPLEDRIQALSKLS